MEVLLYVDNMWNSPNIKITPIIDEGGEQMLGTSIPQCETLIDFLKLFWPTNILKRLCHDQHLCRQRGGKRRPKGKG
jgi:hypothetical protein